MAQVFWEIVVRHRAGIRDLGALILVLVIATFCALTFELTGELSQDQRIELSGVMALGAVTFLGGGLFAWRRFVEQEREIAARTAAENRARYLANHDPLTGLPNRRKLERELSAVTRMTQADGGCHAVFLMDLNGFKKVNDSFGHAAGDEVLSCVATRLVTAVPKGLLARMGGDEFALIVRDVGSADAASAIAASICAALEDPIVTAAGLHQIGTGVGIALCSRDGFEPEELLRKADAALYKSKQQGRGFAFYTVEMEREAREYDRLHRELAISIARGTIVPHYQPIVHLETGEIRAFEALARWTHLELGAVPPARFIPIAEDNGLIKNLTDLLLRQACLDGVQWPQSIGLSFNVSPTLLRDPLFPLRVMAILGETGFAPSRLELEITENAIVRDLEAARDTLGALRDAGVKIALDDFGTGATSLFHLRSFKFDVIKIDRSFVQMMAIENESAQIVKAVLGLAAGLGVGIIAEGIEDQTQRTLLQAQGCNEGQGYLFSRAVSALEATALLTNARADLEISPSVARG